MHGSVLGKLCLDRLTAHAAHLQALVCRPAQALIGGKQIRAVSTVRARNRVVMHGDVLGKERPKKQKAEGALSLSLKVGQAPVHPKLLPPRRAVADWLARGGSCAALAPFGHTHL